MATELISPGINLDDDPEHCELLDGQLVRKGSLGRKNIRKSSGSSGLCSNSFS